MTDLRDLPSWQYFAWGLVNGLLLGISIKEGVDISEEGILSLVLDSFKPLFQSMGMSTTWISLSIFFIGLLGLISLIGEAVAVYTKGWPARVMAISGFVALLFLIIGWESIGVILLFIGAITVAIFPDG